MTLKNTTFASEIIVEIIVQCYYQSMAIILNDNEWAARISWTGAPSITTSADHDGGGIHLAIQLVALIVGCHRDINLLQGSGCFGRFWITESAPTSGSGNSTLVCGFHVGREACGAHFAGEIDSLRQTKDGIVIVMVEHWNSFVVVGVLDEYWNSLIVVGVLDDLSNRQRIELGVTFVKRPLASVVLPNVYLDLGCLDVKTSTSILNAVGCGEDVGGGDEGSSARHVLWFSIHWHCSSLSIGWETKVGSHQLLSLHEQSHLSKDIVTYFSWS